MGVVETQDSTITQSIQYLKGVGPRIAALFAKLDIYTEEDLLFYVPETYQDRRNMPKINSFTPDMNVIFLAILDTVIFENYKRKSAVLEAYMSDETGQIKCVWFNQMHLQKILFKGRRFIIKGKVVWNKFTNEIQVHVSEIEWVKADAEYRSLGIVPVYRLINGLYQSTFRKCIQLILNKNLMTLDVGLPSYTLFYSRLKLSEAIRCIHQPTDLSLINEARNRLIFEEFFYYQLQLSRYRQSFRRFFAHKLIINGVLYQRYIQTLPYSFTIAQSRVVKEVLKDLSQPVAMNRLIQGDVGSGKTDIAMVALLCAVDTQLKGVIMVPTEILAVQHYLKFKSRFLKLGVVVYLLKSKMPVKKKRLIIRKINSNDPCIVVGTHALLEDAIDLPKVGLCIIDEQHRFGVLQRMKLLSKNKIHPHCLFMTATPIPRSYMLSCFGDLDKSIVDQLPPGRYPIKTYFVKKNNIDKVYQFCSRRLLLGEQVYMVYPLVEESEKIKVQSAVTAYQEIKERFLGYCVELLHGRMSPDEKLTVMNRFKLGHCHILVSTTVIEVGIDVANATVMIINHAERFGLSQLHQLRGRIGRGDKQSTCFLVANPKTESGNQRIQAMLKTSNGFKIAEYDLKIRGPGDMLGTRQAGLPPFQVGDIVRDEKVMICAKESVDNLLKKDPNLTDPIHFGISQRLHAKSALFSTKTLN